MLPVGLLRPCRRHVNGFALFRVQDFREIRFWPASVKIDEAFKKRLALLEDVDVGGGHPIDDDVAEGGGQSVLAVGRSRPSDHAVFAIDSRVQRDRPGVDVVPSKFRAVARELRLTQGTSPVGCTPRVGPDGLRALRESVESAAVEQDHASVVQATDQRQRSHGAEKHGPRPRLVQQSPHHDAGMVAIPLDHGRGRVVEPLAHLRRFAPDTSLRSSPHRPSIRSRRTIRADTALAKPAMKRIMLKPMTLQLSKSFRSISGSYRDADADGRVGAGVRGFYEQPPAVQAEIAVLQAEIAESASGRTLVERSRSLDAHPRRHAVHVRVVEVPELGILHGQHGFNRPCRRGTVRGSLRSLGAFRRCWRAKPRRTAGPGAACLPALRTFARTRIAPVRGSGRTNKSSTRTAGADQQFHGIGDAAVIVITARRVGICLVAPRRLSQGDSVNRFVCRVQDATAMRLAACGLMTSVTSRTKASSLPSCRPTWTPLSQTSAR